MNPWGHFKTITHHKLLVMIYCFRVGLIRQGLLHDLSKYSWTEFRIGAKYYSGTHSPNASEREEIGYSTAWLHHKGRNKHHLEYWMDYSGRDFQMTGQPMPTRYMVELCIDRIAACKVYHGKAYTDADPLAYLNRSRDAKLMHSRTKAQVVEILTMLAEKGERATLRYIRKEILSHPVACYANLPDQAEHPEEKDFAFLNGDALKGLANELETPFYLYDEQTIRDRCRQLFDAFSWNPGHRQFFPVKATPTPAVLKVLREEGSGVVCSSAAEMELCRACGFEPDEILFMSNYPEKRDIKAAAALGCPVILDGPGLTESYAELGMLNHGVGLRINPGGVFRFGLTEAQLDGLKFGFTPDGAVECIRELQALGVTSVGLHSYLSGNTLEPDYYPEICRSLVSIAKDLTARTGVRIAFLNISGGLGIPYRPEDRPLDLKAVAESVRTVLETETAGTPLAGIPVYTELGRWVTGPAGLLVTRVNHVRNGFRRIAGTDASASNLMRPMMYQAYHHISAAGKEGSLERSPWDVVGTVSENTDKFAADRMLPELVPGDLLKIHDAGAHGYSMGYQYGGRLRCAEYLFGTDGKARMIRRAETTADYLSTMIF